MNHIRRPFFVLCAALLALIICAYFGIVYFHYTAKAPAPSPSPTTTATPTPTASPTPTPTPSPTTKTQLNLIFGGDIMFGRTVETRMDQYGGDWPLKKLGATMAKADIAVANLESPLRTDAPQTKIDSLVLRGDPKGMASLKEGGVDLVSLANNHITDMGITGLKETTSLLTENGIAFAGAGETSAQAAQPTILTKKGVKIGFLSYTYGVNFDSPGVHYNIADPSQVSTDVRALKPTVDMVIVLVHFGNEYHTTQSSTQTTFAHNAVDAGAALVIGSHPHVPEPYEKYKNGVIFYSLGNLVFDQMPGAGRDVSALASVSITGGTVTGISLLPYKIYNLGQPALLESVSDKNSVWNMFSLPSGSATY